MSLRSSFNLPKEHGAWAMLYVPFALGLAVAGNINWATVWLLLATTSLFISRESLLVWWRARNRGRQTHSSMRAGRLLLIYLSIAAAGGLPLILFYKFYWLTFFALIVAVLLIINGWQAAEFEERSVRGEVMSIAGLSMAAPAAYYVSHGALNQTSLWLWPISASYFASSVFYIKLRVSSLHAKDEERRRIARWQCAAYHLILLGSLLALALTRCLPTVGLIAFAPPLARTFWSLLKPARRLNLTRIGVAEIIYSLIFLIFATLGLRTS